MDGEIAAGLLRQAPRERRAVALDHEIEIDRRPAEREVPHAAADREHALPRGAADLTRTPQQRDPRRPRAASARFDPMREGQPRSRDRPRTRRRWPRRRGGPLGRGHGRAFDQQAARAHLGGAGRQGGKPIHRHVGRPPAREAPSARGAPGLAFSRRARRPPAPRRRSASRALLSAAATRLPAGHATTRPVQREPARARLHLRVGGAGPRHFSARLPRPRVKAHVHVADRARRQMGVDLRRRDVGMAEHRLDGAQVGAALEEMAREGVAQRVRRDRARGCPRAARSSSRVPQSAWRDSDRPKRLTKSVPPSARFTRAGRPVFT